MTKDERKAVIAFLKSFRDMKRETALMGLRLDVLREKLLSPTLALITFNGEDISSRQVHEDALALENELLLNAKRLSDTYRKIERMVDLLESGEIKTAFYARYVCGDTWVKVQHKVGCSERHARRFAYKGLEQFSELFKSKQADVL